MKLVYENRVYTYESEKTMLKHIEKMKAKGFKVQDLSQEQGMWMCQFERHCNSNGGK